MELNAGYERVVTGRKISRVDGKATKETERP